MRFPLNWGEDLTKDLETRPKKFKINESAYNAPNQLTVHYTAHRDAVEALHRLQREHADLQTNYIFMKNIIERHYPELLL